MSTFLLVFQVCVTLALILVILIQPSDDSAFGTSRDSFLSGRAGASFLTRSTAVLAVIFFALCIALAIVSKHSVSSDALQKAITQTDQNSEQTDSLKIPTAPTASASKAPSPPAP